MTTPLRLPDPFTPGTTQATAATPTCSCCCCCCCCCCCVVSAVSTSVALPAGFLRDIDAQRVALETTPTPGRRIPASILLALVPAAMIGVFLLLADEIEFLALIPWSVAALAIAVISVLGGSRSPFSGTLRLLMGTVAGMAEIFVAWPLLAAGPLGIAVYGAAVVAVPLLLLRHYRRERAR